MRVMYIVFMHLHVAVLCVAAGWPDCNYFTYTIISYYN